MKALALTLVFVVSAFAQQLTASNSAAPLSVNSEMSAAPAALIPTSTEASITAMEPAIKPALKLEPTAKVLPETPRRVTDRKFWTATVFQLVAATIDVES